MFIINGLLTTLKIEFIADVDIYKSTRYWITKYNPNYLPNTILKKFQLIKESLLKEFN